MSMTCPACKAPEAPAREGEAVAWRYRYPNDAAWQITQDHDQAFKNTGEVEPLGVIPFGALTTREEAPAEGAGEIGAEYDAAAHCVTLAECPPGLFLFNGSLGFKSEYGAMEPDDATNGKHWKVGNRADAYCADSGEYFRGGATNHDDRAKLLVYPIAAETVAMVASHGPAALRARSSAPEAREGEPPPPTSQQFRPAPDALRVAVEAIWEIAGGRAADGHNEAGRLSRIKERAAEILAALQAEQKGGA